MALTLQKACMPPVNGAAALLMKRNVQPIFMLRETPSSSKGRQASYQPLYAAYSSDDNALCTAAGVLC